MIQQWEVGGGVMTECVGIVLNLVRFCTTTRAYPSLPLPPPCIYASSRCHSSSVHLLYRLLHLVSSKKSKFGELFNSWTKIKGIGSNWGQVWVIEITPDLKIGQISNMKSENVRCRKMGQAHRAQRAIETQVRLLLLLNNHHQFFWCWDCFQTTCYIFQPINENVVANLFNVHCPGFRRWQTC